MERVSEYKYVGVVVNEEGNWKSAAKYVIGKASKRSEEMRWWLARHWGISPRVKIDVWETMVGSVARLGSEVWFPGVKEEIELERVQLRYVKEVLRVNDSKTDEFVRGEVGLFELKREREISRCWCGTVSC